MSEFLNNFKIDAPYKLLAYVGGFVLILALSIDTKWLTNIQTGLLGLGMLATGLGEWFNHKQDHRWINDGAIFQKSQSKCIEEEKRIPTLLGWFLDGVGIIFIILFLSMLLKLL